MKVAREELLEELTLQTSMLREIIEAQAKLEMRACRFVDFEDIIRVNNRLREMTDSISTVLNEIADRLDKLENRSYWGTDDAHTAYTSGYYDGYTAARKSELNSRYGRK